MLTERVVLAGLCSSSNVDMYTGERPRVHLNVSTNILYIILSDTGSQCKSIRSGVAWSYFFLDVTSFAAAFCTFCNFAICFFVNTEKEGVAAVKS